MNVRFIAAYALASLLVVALVFAVLRRQGRAVPEALLLALGAGVSNSMFLGYPFARVLFPAQADTLFAWLMVAETLITIPSLMILSELLADDVNGVGPLRILRRTLAQLARNPAVIGLMAGLGLALLGIRFSGPVETTRLMIVQAAPLLSLCFVGGMVAQAPVRGIGAAVSVIAAGKLILHPLLVWGLLSLVPGAEGALLAGGVLIGAVPMFTIYPVLAARQGAGGLASTALVVTTVPGALSVGILVMILTG